MNVVKRSRMLRRCAAVALICAGLSACGGSSSTTSSGGSSSASSSSGAKASADVTAANAGLAPYQGHPSPFPVDQPLTKQLKPGSTIAYLQCSTPVCGLVVAPLQGAAKLLGAKFTAVPTGSTTSGQTTAMNSIIAEKPTIMMSAGINASPICSQLKQLASAGTAIGTFGMVDNQQCGVQASMNGTTAWTIAGQLLADYAVAKKGSGANVAYYNTPEIGYMPVAESAFKAQLAKLCSSCQARYVTLPVASYGSTAPSMVVSDLQAHAGTNIAVFPSMEAAQGLPAALSTAGIHVLSVGAGPTPSNLQDIKAGKLTAAIGFDIPTMLWMTADAAARVSTGQPLTPGEKVGLPPIRVLEQKDITFNPAGGYSGYPDFATRFAKIWKGK